MYHMGRYKWRIQDLCEVFLCPANFNIKIEPGDEASTIHVITASL